MGRIAFFTEILPAENETNAFGADPIATFSFELIKTLADQQHEVRVFSTYRDGEGMPKPRPRIEILRPFRRWGWFELPKMLPLLIDFQPDILHFIQPRAESMGGWTNAMAAISNLAPFIGRPAVVSSYYDLREDRIREHRTLLRASDVITVSNQPQLDLLENFLESEGSSRFKRTLSAVVPISSALATPQDSEGHPAGLREGLVSGSRDDEFVRSFFETHAQIIFVPGQIDEHPEVSDLFAGLAACLTEFPQANVVFGGGWGQIPQRTRQKLMAVFEEKVLSSRVLVSGPLAPGSLRFCLARAELVLLASIAMTSLQLIQVMSEALAANAVLLLNREQSLLTGVPWRDRENAFVVDNARETWWATIHDALNSRELVEGIRARLPDFARAEALDQPGNVVSRLYSEALSLKLAHKRGKKRDRPGTKK